MRNHYPHLGLARVCALFGVTRQSHYQFHWRFAEYCVEESMILSQVKEIRLGQPRIGTRKLYEMLTVFLREHQIKIGRDGLFDLLARNRLLVAKRKLQVYTTLSHHRLRKYKDLVKGQPPPLVPNQLWVSDITYLKTKAGFVYISLVTDAYSRKIIGYHIATTLEAVHCLTALKMALKGLDRDIVNLTHHSDRGMQYCCDAYVGLLNGHKIRISMTESGDPLDNAIAERVNGILKGEYLTIRKIRDLEHAERLLIMAVRKYNHERPHMSLEMLTPAIAHLGEGELERKWRRRKYGPGLQGMAECV